VPPPPSLPPCCTSLTNTSQPAVLRGAAAALPSWMKDASEVLPTPELPTMATLMHARCSGCVPVLLLRPKMLTISAGSGSLAPLPSRRYAPMPASAAIDLRFATRASACAATVTPDERVRGEGRPGWGGEIQYCSPAYHDRPLGGRGWGAPLSAGWRASAVGSQLLSAVSCEL
jgi:hypothetical protein